MQVNCDSAIAVLIRRFPKFHNEKGLQYLVMHAYARQRAVFVGEILKVFCFGFHSFIKFCNKRCHQIGASDKGMPTPVGEGGSGR